MPWRNPERAAALAAGLALAEAQGGVVSRCQALAAGLTVGLLRGLAESGEWQVLHRGVYLARRGEANLLSRMWAAWLAVGPEAVVYGPTAGAYWGLGDPPCAGSPVSILIPEAARVFGRPGIAARRVRDPGSRAHPSRRPLVTSVEHTVIDLVGAARSDTDALEVVARACRHRLTTPQRILATATTRPRIARRDVLRQACADFETGVTSPLERAYARRVERAHGLARGVRQSRATLAATGATVYRDVVYPRYGVIVELDGRLGHEGHEFRDQTRDNAATLTGAATLRFGTRAVLGDPCGTAAQVAALLSLRGWPGSARQCGAGCRFHALLSRPGSRSLGSGPGMAANVEFTNVGR